MIASLYIINFHKCYVFMITYTCWSQLAIKIAMVVDHFNGVCCKCTRCTRMCTSVCIIVDGFITYWWVFSWLRWISYGYALISYNRGDREFWRMIFTMTSDIHFIHWHICTCRTWKISSILFIIVCCTWNW